MGWLNLIDLLYLIFSVLTLYFSFLFLLLFIGNRSRMNRVPKTSEFPSVSILVPARNEEKTITQTISNLLNLEYPRKKVEVMVIDDASTDKTAELAKAAGAIVLRIVKRGGKAAALNEGLKKAHGEIVACVDADSYPKQDALIKSIPFFEDSHVSAVTARILVKSGKGILNKLQKMEYAMIAWSRKLFEFIDAVYVTPGPLSLYRRKLLLELGGFDEKNITEDIEIAWRMLSNGWKIAMSPATTFTDVPRKWRNWLRQRLRWNIGGIQTAMKYMKCTFASKSSFSLFVLPFFTISYGLSLLALSIFVWLVYLWIWKNLTFFFAASSVGLNPVKGWEPFLLPDLFTIFGLLVFVFSIIILSIGLKEMGESRHPKTWIFIAVYLTLYITIFPFLLVYSILQFFSGYRSWGTK